MKKQIILAGILTVCILMCACGSRPSKDDYTQPGASDSYEDDTKTLNPDSVNYEDNENNGSEDNVTFGAVIYQVMENSILVKSVEKPDDANSGQMYYVSLENISSKELQTNQCAEITFDGSVKETYPAQITATKINVVGVANNIDGIINKEYFNSEIKPVQAIRLDDVLYYNTYTESDIVGRCGVMDGKIDKTISPSETPVENNQSNFSAGLGYQWVDDYNVDVFIDEKFIRFKSIP